jgi:WD40 repeat protein
VAFSPDGSSAAVTGQGAGGRTADVWNTATGTLVTKVSDPADYKVASAAFSANGSELAIGDFDGGQKMSEARTWARA